MIFLIKKNIKIDLGQCNLNYKTIILQMVSLGMGIVKVRSLKVKNFLDLILEYFRRLNIVLDIDQVRQRL